MIAKLLIADLINLNNKNSPLNSSKKFKKSAAHMQNQRKKCASYAIEMMLKFSNVFNQMSDLCRNAVVDFSRDLTLHDEYEKFTKYRVSDVKQQKIQVFKPMPKQQQQAEQTTFDKIRTRKTPKIQRQSPVAKKIVQPKSLQVDIRPNSSKVQQKPQQKQQQKTQLRPKRQPKSQRITKKPEPIVQQKSQSSQKVEKKQQVIPTNKNNNIQNNITIRPPRLKVKDPILEQNNEGAQPLGKRVNRANKKVDITLSLSDSNISSQPSDYKSRQPRKSSSGKRSSKGRRKSKTPSVQGQPQTKRPINGFMRFFHEVKDEIKKKYKLTKLSELSPMISLEWKKLTPQQQEQYNNVYYAQMEKFRKDEKEKQKNQGQKKQETSKKQDQVKDGQSEQQSQQNSDQHQQDDQQDQEDQGSDEQSGSSSQQKENEQEQENSPSTEKKRKVLKVKRPVPQEAKQPDTVNQKQESSVSEEFSISDSNSNSDQENSQSSSDQNKKKKGTQPSSKEAKATANKRKQ